MKITGQAHIYRFHDHVAVNLPQGDTVYMTPAFARAFARALMTSADDISRFKFFESPLGMTTITNKETTDAEDNDPLG
jgi:hypothetical protein